MLATCFYEDLERSGTSLWLSMTRAKVCCHLLILLIVDSAENTMIKAIDIDG